MDIKKKLLCSPDAPPPPLHTLVHHQSDPPQVDLFDRVRPRLDAWQEQSRLLDLRGQIGQPHDVRHASSRDLASEYDAAMSKFES